MKAVKTVIGVALYAFAIIVAAVKFGIAGAAAASLAGLGVSMIHDAITEELEEVIEGRFELIDDLIDVLNKNTDHLAEAHAIIEEGLREDAADE